MKWNGLKREGKTRGELGWIQARMLSGRGTPAIANSVFKLMDLSLTSDDIL